MKQAHQKANDRDDTKEHEHRGDSGHDQRRRTLLGWLAGTAVAVPVASTAWAADAATMATTSGGGKHVARIGDAAMALEFDGQLRCRVLSKHAARPAPAAITAFAPSERLRLKSGHWIERFALTAQAADRVDGPHGAGVRHRFTGVAAEGLEKTVNVTFYDRHPGFAIVRVGYRNTGRATRRGTVSIWPTARPQSRCQTSAAGVPLP